MGSGLTKTVIETVATSSAKAIEEKLQNAIQDLGSGADYRKLEDTVEEYTAYGPGN